jgi:hypothetical protein
MTERRLTLQKMKQEHDKISVFLKKNPLSLKENRKKIYRI